MKRQEKKAACIFLEHRDFVKEQALRFAPFPGTSEDIFQEVFIEFVSKAEHWDFDEDVRPLLVVLTRRMAARALDAKKKNLPEKLNQVVEQLCKIAENRQRTLRVGEASPYEQIRAALKHCLDLLPTRSRTLVDLYYFEKVSTERIAERMILSANAVYLSIHRVRERLKKCISKTLQQWRET